jgi:hypothetical protein
MCYGVLCHAKLQLVVPGSLHSLHRTVLAFSCHVVQELMSEQGGHRPATLKCGHIFGEACIRRWLKEKSRCPQCNKP